MDTFLIMHIAHVLRYRLAVEDYFKYEHSPMTAHSPLLRCATVQCSWNLWFYAATCEYNNRAWGDDIGGRYYRGYTSILDDQYAIPVWESCFTIRKCCPTARSWDTESVVRFALIGHQRPVSVTCPLGQPTLKPLLETRLHWLSPWQMSVFMASLQ